MRLTFGAAQVLMLIDSILAFPAFLCLSFPCADKLNLVDMCSSHLLNESHFRMDRWHGVSKCSHPCGAAISGKNLTEKKDIKKINSESWTYEVAKRHLLIFFIFLEDASLFEGNSILFKVVQLLLAMSVFFFFLISLFICTRHKHHHFLWSNLILFIYLFLSFWR